MRDATTAMAGDPRQGAVGRAKGTVAVVARDFRLTPRWSYVVSCAIPPLILLADILLPRGATAAIGYCLVPAAAAGTRRRRFVLGATIACTVLTWVGYFTESAGAAAPWMSVFDRVMVSGVLWLALLLVWRRAVVIRALVHQARALELATGELERSNVELENFASVVAHDLRGPLNTVGLLAETLSATVSAAGRDDPDRWDAGCIESIRDEVTRMSALIQSLLTYGRLGSSELRLADCDCTLVLAGVRRNLRADLERLHAQVTNDPLPIVRADPVLIGELFQNLIENSLKYRSEAVPHIHISAVQEPDGWLFLVRDNGIGIRPEDFARIFEPFRRATGGGSDHPARGRGGVGLGLATCKRIVERHGGRIEVESSPGNGSTFRFTLPSRLGSPERSTSPKMRQEVPS